MAPITFSGARNFKYGMPLYGVAWPEGGVFYLCGGGGMGIKNRLVFAESKYGLMTDQIGEHLFGSDCPMKMAMAPSGKSIVFAMAKGGIMRVDVEVKGAPKQKVPKIIPVTGDLQRRLATIEGDVRCLCFNSTGEQLALGLADGALQVYEWPSMKLKMDLSGSKKLPSSVRDVDFGSWRGLQEAGGTGTGRPVRVISAVLDDGMCELWDWEKSEQFCSIKPLKGRVKNDRVLAVSNTRLSVSHMLPKGMEGTQFVSIRFFSQATEGDFGFHALTNSSAGGACISKWLPTGSTCFSSKNSAIKDTAVKLPSMPGLVCSRRAAIESGTCFTSNKDGSLVALGTSEGSAVVIKTSDMKVIRKLLKAHMVFTTGVTFSPDEKHLMSISADASVQIMSIEGPMPKKGSLIHKIICLTFIAVAIFLTCFAQYLRVLQSQGHDLHAMRQRFLKQVWDFLGLEWVDTPTPPLGDMHMPHGHMGAEGADHSEL